MKILLDTQIALWAWFESERIPREITAAIVDPDNEVYFSQVSTWEIQIKYDLGKLKMEPAPAKFLPNAIERSGFRYQPIQDDAIFFLGRLPSIHRDPFDRLLIAQTMVGNFKMATVDSKVLEYPVQTVD
ncbi:type II toxin-antitoxin system VapC family toxin [Verrucomicrobia bacterium]|nr:type II toxin-antitoxin system VapC family toxin [Verrucomicrobiota bacterium]